MIYNLDLTTIDTLNDAGTGTTHAILDRNGNELDAVTLDLHAEDAIIWQDLADRALRQQGYERVQEWTDEHGRARDTVRVRAVDASTQQSGDARQTVSVACRPTRSAVWGAPESADLERLIELIRTAPVGSQLLIRAEQGAAMVTHTKHGWHAVRAD